jgi:hypothetical protein
VILLISSPWVAKIIGMGHRCLAPTIKLSSFSISMMRYPSLSCLSFCLFWWCWCLNSELHTWYKSALPLQPHPWGFSLFSKYFAYAGVKLPSSHLHLLCT